MAKKALRAVRDDDIPARPLTVLEAAESGSRLAELVAIRAVLARAIDNDKTSPRDLAALSRRQIEVSREIEALRIQEAEEANEHAIADEEWRPAAI